MVRRGWKLAVAVCGIIIFIFGGTSLAHTVTVTIGVGDTILNVQGLTSPGAFATISRDGSVIGTAVAGSDGSFNETYPAQAPGVHSVSAFAQTTSDHTTDTVTTNINIAEHATTTVHIFLPPTLIIEKAALDYGESLNVHGETAPFCTVVIYIDSSTYATAVADANGNWHATIPTTGLATGQHDIFARAIDGLGEQSYPTSMQHFTIASEPTQPGAGTQPPGTSQPQTGGGPGAPTITYPTPGSTVTDPTIVVRGTAEPNVQIELWDNGHPIGSVWSNANGDWAIPLQLEAGEYSLRARACIDGVCGPFSSTVTFKFAPKSSLGDGIRIRADKFAYSTYQRETVEIPAWIEGGRPPFKVELEWDENTHRAYTINDHNLPLRHTYDAPGHYTVKVRVYDSEGRSDEAFFTVQVKPRSSAWFLPIVILVLLLLLLIILEYYRRKRRQPAQS